VATNEDHPLNTLATLPSDLHHERVLDTQQAAEFVGLSIPHFRRMYRSGQVPSPIKIGTRKLGWKLSALIAFLAEKAK
jgi:prophage regulatory protein